MVRLFRGETNRVVHLRIAKAASVQRGRSQRHRVGQGKGGSSSDGEEGSADPDLASDGEQTIRSTVGHPYFVVGRGWVHAKDLRVGDELSGSQGERLVVTGLDVREERAKHYNFEVEGFHTYFVSEKPTDEAVLVHNAGGGLSCGPNDVPRLPYFGKHSKTLRQVQSGRGKARAPAGEVLVREMHGGKPVQFQSPLAPRDNVLLGSRNVDSYGSPGSTQIAAEVKTYYLHLKNQRNRTVRLDDHLRGQIYADVFWRRTLGVQRYDPRWVFVHAPPSKELADMLKQAKIVSVHYGPAPRRR